MIPRNVSTCKIQSWPHHAKAASLTVFSTHAQSFIFDPRTQTLGATPLTSLLIFSSSLRHPPVARLISQGEHGLRDHPLILCHPGPLSGASSTDRLFSDWGSIVNPLRNFQQLEILSLEHRPEWTSTDGYTKTPTHPVHLLWGAPKNRVTNRLNPNHRQLHMTLGIDLRATNHERAAATIIHLRPRRAITAPQAHRGHRTQQELSVANRFLRQKVSRHTSTVVMRV